MKCERKSICIITGTRAEYGLLRPLIKKLESDKAIELHLVATGTHLEPAFGETYREIEKDGYTIHEKIKLPLESDTDAGMAKATGTAIILFTDYFEKNHPDMLVILGDRFEIFAAVIAASMLHIPIAHIAGGDTTEGAVDEFIRHCITKMSYLHFTSNEESRKRVIQLGESPDRVFNAGALNLDNVYSTEFLTREELSDMLQFNLSGQCVLVTYHPTTMLAENATEEIDELLNAINKIPDMKFIFTKANADAGGRAINARLDEFVKTHDNCAVYTSLGSEKYLSVMKYACMVIGNSSSGLYETPCFGIPCVNIGDRQRGRLHADNVMHCKTKSDAIISAIKQALTDEFIIRARNAANPFGDGHASEKIVAEIKSFLDNDNINISKEFYNI